MNNTDKKLDFTLEDLLKSRHKSVANKSEKELVSLVFQELKFLGLVPMEADQTHATYQYIQNRIPLTIKRRESLTLFQVVIIIQVSKPN